MILKSEVPYFSQWQSPRLPVLRVLGLKVNVNYNSLCFVFPPLDQRPLSCEVWAFKPPLTCSRLGLNLFGTNKTNNIRFQLFLWKCSKTVAWSTLSQYRNCTEIIKYNIAILCSAISENAQVSSEIVWKCFWWTSYFLIRKPQTM